MFINVILTRSFYLYFVSDHDGSPLTSPDLPQARESGPGAQSRPGLSSSDFWRQIQFREEREKSAQSSTKHHHFIHCEQQPTPDLIKDQARNLFSTPFLILSAVIATKYLKKGQVYPEIEFIQGAGHGPDLLRMQPPHRGSVHHEGRGQHPSRTLPQVRFLDSWESSCCKVWWKYFTKWMFITQLELLSKTATIV